MRGASRFLTALALLAGISAVAACGSTSGGPSATGSQNAAQALAQGGVLKCGMAEDPPFTFLDSSGHYTSLIPALLQKFEAYADVKLQYVPATYTTIVAGLQANKYAFICADLHATPARKLVVNFTTAFSGSGDVFFVRGNDNRFSTLNDLNSPNVSVAIVAGSASESDSTVLTKAKFVKLANVPTAILVADLTAGHVDAFATSSYLAPALVAQYGFKTIPDIATQPDGVLSVPLAWAVPKQDGALLTLLNTFLAHEQSDGDLAALKTQWLTVANSLKG